MHTQEITPSWAYINFSPSNNSDPCILYFLICSSVRLLVLNLSLMYFLTRSWMCLTSNFFWISIICIHNTDLLPVLFTFIVWTKTKFLANVSAVTLNILCIHKKKIIFFDGIKYSIIFHLSLWFYTTQSHNFIFFIFTS